MSPANKTIPILTAQILNSLAIKQKKQPTASISNPAIKTTFKTLSIPEPNIKLMPSLLAKTIEI